MRIGNFSFVLSASFLSEFARSMYFLVIAWVLFELTNDATYTGMLVGLGFLPGLVFNLLAGVIVDRYNRKWLAIGANVVITFAMIALLTAMFSGIVRPWMIIGVHMILQVLSSLYRPAQQAFVAELFEKEQLPKVYSQTSAGNELGSMLGSSLGGLIVAMLSPTASIAVVCLCFLLSATALSLTKRTVSIERASKHASVVSDLVGGFSYIRRNNYLLGLFTLMFIGQLTAHSSIAFLSVYTQDHLGASVTTYGLLDATIAVGGIVAGLLGTWWWKKNGRTVATRSLLFIGAGLLCMGLAPAVPVAFLGVFLIGLGTTWIRVLLQSIQQMATDPAYYGRMASFRMLCNQGSVVIGGPVLGWVAHHQGVTYSYLALLVPVSFAVLFSLVQAKQHIPLPRKELST